MARLTGQARVLPTGTLTFLFSDIEGSTRLLSTLGPAFGPLLERHQALLRAAFEASGGIEVSTEGDSFFVVFMSAPSAVAAAAAAQRALASEPWPPEVGSVRVRMGLHTGEGTRGGDNYVGLDVHRAARIAAAAHGGQVILSETTRALVRGALPDDLILRDLGEYRLKGLEQPDRLVQLVVRGLQEEFPAPRTLETPSNLPTQATSFVGREREVEEISRLVRRSRLLTLVGPGGTGKTRLGLRVAETLSQEFADGCFFVDLSPISDAELIPTTIAQAIGVREEATRPIVQSLTDHLRELRLLLMLDNFEQVLRGAPLVGDLLRAAPNLSILVTSREVLHVRGEQEYAVPSLALPDVRQLPRHELLAQYDAILLFTQRAQAVRPQFAVDAANAPAIAAICARLDGLPLAIELAAARIKVLAPDAILTRLEKRLAILTSAAGDLPARQRTLRGAIDWSHELLDATERTLLRRLAVFVGGWTIEAAEAVSDPDGELHLDMLDALASLVDKSLVRQVSVEGGEPRFGMLETIREYALERLAESEDADRSRRRHQDYFATLARRAETELVGSRQKEWLDRLDGERDNLRTALQEAADDGRTDQALMMGGALWRFLQQRGHLGEGRQMLEELLGRSAAAPRTAARAKALSGLGGVAYWQGDFIAAAKAYAEALDIERGLDDQDGLADALYNAGFVAAISGDHAAARMDYEESLDIYTRLGDRMGVARSREALVFLMFRRGEYAAARELQEENLRLFREAGEQFRVANGLNLLSAIRLREGDFEPASAHQAEALGIFEAAGDVQGVVRVLVLAASLAMGEGDPERAARLSGLADGLKEPLGEVATPIEILGLEDPAQASQVLLGEAAFQLAYQAGRAMSIDQAIDLLRA